MDVMRSKSNTTSVDTRYITTDFDLKSKKSFDLLNCELDQTCCVLHYTCGEDGHWHSIVESSLDDGMSERDATVDILSMIDAITDLSSAAKAEFDAGYVREFNIGFHCWDTWSYTHAIPSSVVRAIADAGCSIAVTLYPMRNPDGTPRE